MVRLDNGVAALEFYLDGGISPTVCETGDLASYDPRIRALLCPLIPVGGVVVDGGAYIGDHTVAYAEAVGPEGHVWAFEPSFQALECLMINTETLPQVHVVTAALADRRCDLALYVEWGGAPCSRVGPETPGGIPAVPLDAFTFDRLDYLKLDLEGYELRALHGAEQQLRRHRPIVVVESGRQLERYGDSHEALVAFMTALDYVGELLPYQHAYHGVFDLLFRPQES